jgi:hypothetical protein
VAWVPHRLQGRCKVLANCIENTLQVAISCQHISVLRCFAACEQPSAKGARLH